MFKGRLFQILGAVTEKALSLFDLQHEQGIDKPINYMTFVT